MSRTVGVASCLLALALSGGVVVAQEPPDYTKGDKVVGNVTWALGPTGAHGSIWSRRFDTTGVTQIYVTGVDPDSPGAEMLRKGDVIVGVISPHPATRAEKAAGPRFMFDARKELAASIIEAERIEHGGKLVLNVWREGSTREIAVPLRPMGTFSATAPANCEKTDRIVRQACDYLEKNGLKRGIAGQIDALGLLATGDKKYLPMVQQYVREYARPDLALDFSEGKKAWHWGYTNLLLTEYYLATGDTLVLPAIKEYTTKIAMGQSVAGTWGHGMAPPIPDGDGFRHGILGGYGALNQAGLACAISLVLGRKCGVESPVVDRAIDRAASFFRFYVDKGSVPYGDHAPWMRYASNGKTAAAAVLFDLLGDERAASFFSRMTVASYEDLESGHTGNYWSFLWGGLGAAVAGDDAEAAFLKEIRWYYELERRWPGNIVYQGQLTDEPYKYRDWSCTGARLLHYCAPRKQLHITGKAGRAAKPLTGDDLAATLAAGRDGLTRDKPAEELLVLLGSWSPIVRREAAEALGNTDADVVQQLIPMLLADDRYARYGACEGLRFAGRDSVAAAETLIASGLNSDDPTLRYHAMYAFTLKRRGGKGMTGVAHLALPTLLKLATELDSSDPLQYHVATVLFYSGNVEPIDSICRNGRHLDKVDRDLLVRAIRSLLRTSNGGGRSMVSRVVYPHLTSAELQELWGDIYVATTERAPSGVMFADGVRADGVELMAKHGIQEGLDAGVRFVTEDRWGSHGRIVGGVPAMAGYGGAVRDVLPMMKQMIEERYAKDPKNRAKYLAILEKAATEERPPLTSIAPQIERARKGDR